MTDLTREGLVELATKVEQASGPSIALEQEIAMAIYGAQASDVAGITFIDGHVFRVPAYTASLDAAMTLVDGIGVLMALSDIGADGLPLARVARPDIDGGPICSGIASCIMTETAPVAGLAIAVCAAALRARAMEAGRVG